MRPSLGIPVVVVLTGIAIAAFATHWDARAERGKREVATLTDKMKTICVGRFLIDMPQEAQVELTGARIEGFDIAAFQESVTEFQTRLAQREAEIRSKPDLHGGNKNLESTTAIRTDTGLAGKIFVHSRMVTEGTAGNGIENEHFRYEGIAVEGLVHGNGVSVDLSTDYYSPEKTGNLNKLITQLVPNPLNQKPPEPGFCMDRAYFRDPLKAEQGEQITMFANLPNHPDLDFNLMMIAGIKPDKDGLLKRGEESEAELTFLEKMRFSRLRAAPRVIGGLSGEELVRRVIERNDATVYSFRWEVNGIEDDVFTPHLVFSMMTGKSNAGPVPTSMSEDAALKLWDRISSSIRLGALRERKPTSAQAPSTLGVALQKGEYD
jgi:hypothetical protein